MIFNQYLVNTFISFYLLSYCRNVTALKKWDFLGLQRDKTGTIKNTKIPHKKTAIIRRK